MDRTITGQNEREGLRKLMVLLVRINPPRAKRAHQTKPLLRHSAALAPSLRRPCSVTPPPLLRHSTTLAPSPRRPCSVTPLPCPLPHHFAALSLAPSLRCPVPFPVTPALPLAPSLRCPAPCPITSLYPVGQGDQAVVALDEVCHALPHSVRLRINDPLKNLTRRPTAWKRHSLLPTPKQ